MATTPKRQVGEVLAIKIGGKLRRARIVEDRGNLGARGQQVVRIAVDSQDPDDELEFELAEEQLEALTN